MTQDEYNDQMRAMLDGLDAANIEAKRRWPKDGGATLFSAAPVGQECEVWGEGWYGCGGTWAEAVSLEARSTAISSVLSAITRSGCLARTMRRKACHRL